MYMQVDVPMERMPVANWLLIAGTCVISAGLWVGETKHDRAASELVAQAVYRKAESANQLQGKRLTPKQREAAEAKTEEELSQFFTERMNALGESPLAKWALHTDRDDFRLTQLVTHLFAHGDVLHLIGNMLFLFCFGNAVCAKVGNLLYVPLYLLLGVLAGVVSVVLNTGTGIGASAAIMGVTGVFLVLYPFNEIAVWTFRSMVMTGDAWRFPSWLVIVAYMALDLAGVLIDRQYGGGVDYVSHVAGGMCGVGVGFALVMSRFVESLRGEQFLPEAWGWLGEKPAKPRKRKKKRREPPDEQRVYEV